MRSRCRDVHARYAARHCPPHDLAPPSTAANLARRRESHAASPQHRTVRHGAVLMANLDLDPVFVQQVGSCVPAGRSQSSYPSRTGYERAAHADANADEVKPRWWRQLVIVDCVKAGAPGLSVTAWSR